MLNVDVLIWGVKHCDFLFVDFLSVQTWAPEKPWVSLV